MRVEKFKNRPADFLYEMPYEGKNIPHMVLEVNQKCNITCKACYKSLYNYTKPLEQIKQEIDFIITKRNLHVITLAGGEPTLHPNLPEVIRYIVRKRILVDMLSNGYALTDNRLSLYKKAGINKIYLHIDAQQKRPDLKENFTEKDLNDLRTSLSNKIRNHGIECALEITLYQKTLSSLPSFINYFLHSKNFRALLVTNCTDPTPIAENRNKKYLNNEKHDSESLKDEVVLNKEVLEILHKNHRMLPYAYLSSNLMNDEIRWLFYFSFTIHLKNGQTKVLHLNPSFKFIVDWACRTHLKKYGKYPFAVILTPMQSF
ncbi:MAG: radical SAM protein, partial [Bacteroidia bacterium]|nr:radical SAM protein [Bacteroidia bacterium]